MADEDEYAEIQNDEMAMLEAVYPGTLLFSKFEIIILVLFSWRHISETQILSKLKFLLFN